MVFENHVIQHTLKSALLLVLQFLRICHVIQTNLLIYKHGLKLGEQTVWLTSKHEDFLSLMPMLLQHCFDGRNNYLQGVMSINVLISALSGLNFFERHEA